MKSSLSNAEVLLHMDFSENYQCKFGSEIQALHFGRSKPQITIHTSVLYYKKQNETEVSSLCMATLSEDCRHDPIAIIAHLEPVTKFIRDMVPNLKTIHFLSDGAPTQYKNKTMFQLFGSVIPTMLNNVALKKMTWNYSESGHGKGAPDGVGACLKRTVDRMVANSKDVPDFTSFVESVTERCPGIKTMKVHKERIIYWDKEVKKVGVKKENLKVFKGTSNIHQITWQDGCDLIHARRLTCMECETHTECPHYGIGKINIVQLQMPQKSKNPLYVLSFNR